MAKINIPGVSIKASSSGELASTSQQSSITKNNITWTLAASNEVGQSVNGEYFVIDPGGGLDISSVSPAKTGTGSGVRNGSVVNPTGGRQQGYDGRVPNTLNESIIASFPLTVSAGDSLVSTASRASAVSLPDQWNAVPDGTNVQTAAGTQYVNDCEVLTVLADIPFADSLRPPFAGTVKPLWRQADMDFSVLGSNSLSIGKPNLAYLAIVADLLSRPWLDNISGWEQRLLHPVNNMSDYGQAVSDTTNTAAMLLCLDYSDTEKLELATNFVQVGIDLYYMALNGTQWWSDGGHGQGRKISIVMTGLLLNDADLKAHFGTYSEEAQTYYGVTNSANAGQSKIAFWGDTASDAYYQNGCTGGGVKTGRPSTLDDDGCCLYRNCCSSATWIGAMLSMLMTTGGKTAWDDDKWSDYCDRWMGYGLDPQVLNCNIAISAGSVSVPWIASAWNQYRSNLEEIIMGVQALIYARPEAARNLGKASTGIIQTVREEVDLPEHPWGNREVFPDYIKITVTDAVKSDLDQWLVPSMNEFTYEIVNQNPTRVRYRISVLPQLQAQFGEEAFSQSLIDFVVDLVSATVFQSNLNAGFAVFDIPPENFDEAEIQSQLFDLFSNTLAARRYRMNDATVNQGNAANGFLTMDLVEFNSRVLDSLI